MSQLLQVNPQNEDFVKGLILSEVYQRDEKSYIKLHNSRLDFHGEFEFLGFTKKANKIKIAETNTDFKQQYASLNLEKFDHVDGRVFYVVKIITTGYSYIHRLEAEL